MFSPLLSAVALLLLSSEGSVQEQCPKGSEGTILQIY